MVNTVREKSIQNTECQSVCSVIIDRLSAKIDCRSVKSTVVLLKSTVVLLKSTVVLLKSMVVLLKLIVIMPKSIVELTHALSISRVRALTCISLLNFNLHISGWMAFVTGNKRK